MPANLLKAWPYQDDVMSLPVADVEASAEFYTRVMGFTVVERGEAPFRTAVLERGAIRIGLAENGGDPTQDGVAFEVDDIKAAYAEFTANGLAPAGDGERPAEGTISAEIGSEQRGATAWKTFFIVAPDGLCYWIGERAS